MKKLFDESYRIQEERKNQVMESMAKAEQRLNQIQ